ncbi:MAG: hypothetical protein NVS3B12_23130 [Acidimicrobiales bacterium]
MASVVMWGTGNVLVKYIRLDGMAIAFNRLWLGAALFSALLVTRGGRLSWSSLRIAAPGGIAFALDVSLFFTAIKHTSVADASIITALQPALLFLVAGRLFGEQVQAATVGWTLVAIAGVTVAVLASASSAGRTGEGDLIALASVVAWAWYFVASKQARQQLGALEYQAALSVVAAVVVTPLAFVSSHHLVIRDPSTFGWIMLMVLVPGGGHLIMNWAHEYAPITLVSMVTLGIPVIATVGAAVALGEAVTLIQGGGMVLVVVALAMVLRRPPVATIVIEGPMPEVA